MVNIFVTDMYECFNQSPIDNLEYCDIAEMKVLMEHKTYHKCTLYLVLHL